VIPWQTAPSNKWIMQSVNVDGRNETVGGDEIYVTYTDSNAARKGTLDTVVRDA
jgi:hypothetical protein